MESLRFERQVRFFGEEGQRKIRNTKPLVIGAGGIGSHVIQQLAFLGVGALHIIDPDVLEKTNANRLIGVNDADQAGKSKAAIAERLVRRINPNIDVTAEQQDVLELIESRDQPFGTDWVFSCVDDDGVRLKLLQEVAGGPTLIDCATEVVPREEGLPNFGGRICVADGTDGCPYCRDLYDEQEIRHSLADADELQDEAERYGVAPEELEDSGPSVVTLNGIVASLACNEFMAAVAGIRKPKPILEYRGNYGIVAASQDPLPDSCLYCDDWRTGA